MGTSANVRSCFFGWRSMAVTVREISVRHICAMSPVATPSALRVCGVLKSTIPRKSSSVK